MARNIQYSEKYADDMYEYRSARLFAIKANLLQLSNVDNHLCRHVILPSEVARECPKDRLLSEDEWRRIGVQQSRGWEHYAIHK
jgi:cyclin-dependent kinase regulatory subunit CKS1